MSKLNLDSNIEFRNVNRQEFSLNEFDSSDLDKQAKVRQRIEALVEQRALKKQLSDEWDE